jgi:Tol biopolymer transport system component
LHGVAGAARWSPNGRYIAFEFRPNDRSEYFLWKCRTVGPGCFRLYLVRITEAPSWSRDGRWIYFYWDKGGGPLQLWKVPVQAGPPVQVTKKGGVFALESEDEGFIYFSKYDVSGIWRMPVQGGTETRILEQPDGSDWFNWGLTRQGIYFLDSSAEPNASLKFFEFASGKQFTIYIPSKRAEQGLAVSPDGRSVVYVQRELAESSIMLVKNFQ